MSRYRLALRHSRSTSRCGRFRAGGPWSSRSLGSAADPRVQKDGSEQDPTLERERPVAVPLRIDDSQLHHAEHGGAEEGADHGTEAAGEQAAADDGADDEDELQADPFSRLHRAELERFDDPHQRSGSRGHHEQQDLRARHGYTYVARGVRVAAGGVDPVAETGL